MYGMELYAAVRLAVVGEGLSHHEAAQRSLLTARPLSKFKSDDEAKRGRLRTAD